MPSFAITWTALWALDGSVAGTGLLGVEARREPVPAPEHRRSTRQRSSRGRSGRSCSIPRFGLDHLQPQRKKQITEEMEEGEAAKPLEHPASARVVWEGSARVQALNTLRTKNLLPQKLHRPCTYYTWGPYPSFEPKSLNVTKCTKWSHPKCRGDYHGTILRGCWIFGGLDYWEYGCGPLCNYLIEWFRLYPGQS